MVVSGYGALVNPLNVFIIYTESKSTRLVCGCCGITNCHCLYTGFSITLSFSALELVRLALSTVGIVADYRR